MVIPGKVCLTLSIPRESFGLCGQGMLPPPSLLDTLQNVPLSYISVYLLDNFVYFSPKEGNISVSPTLLASVPWMPFSQPELIGF